MNRRLPFLLAAVLAGVLFLDGCAYYNTFYHAKQFYGQAERQEEAARKQKNRGASGTNRTGRSGELYTQCIQKCRKVLEVFPKSRWADDAQFLMARAYYGKGDYLVAARELRRFEARFPKSDLLPKVYFWEGLTAFSGEDYEEASRAWDRLLKEAPDYEDREEVHFYLAETLRLQHRYKEAATSYAAFLNESPKHERAAEARINLGSMLLEEKRYAEAADEFQRVARKGRNEEDRFQAKLLLGEAHELNKEYEEALQMYRDLAYDLDPNYLDGRMTPEEREAQLQEEQAAREAAALDSTLASTFGGTDPSGGRQDESGIPGGTNNPGAVGNPNDPNNPNNSNNPNNRNNPNNPNNRNNANNRSGRATSGGAAVQYRRPTALPATDPHYTELARVLLREGRVLAALERPWEAILAYDQVIAEYPRSEFAAEAEYQIGYTQEVYLEDLAAAEAAYAKVPTLGRSAFNEDAAQRAKKLGQVKATSAALADTVSQATQAQANARFLRAELYLFQQEKPKKALEEYAAIQSEFPGTDQEAKAALAEAWVRFTVLADTARGRAKYAEVMTRFPETPYGRFATRLLKGPEREPGPEEFMGPSLDELLTGENLASVAERDSMVAAAMRPPDTTAVGEATGGDSTEAPSGIVVSVSQDGVLPGGTPPAVADGTVDSLAAPVDSAAAALAARLALLDPDAVPEGGPNAIQPRRLLDEAPPPIPSPETPGNNRIQGLSASEAQALFDSLTAAGETPVPAGFDSLAATGDTLAPAAGDIATAPAPPDTTSAVPRGRTGPVTPSSPGAVPAPRDTPADSTDGADNDGR